MAALKENSKTILKYVQAHDGEDFTAQDIADATGIPARSVNGSITSAFQKKGYMVREEVAVEDENGKEKTVKFIRLTDQGRALDPDAE